VVPPAQYPELHAILTAAYRGEFGLECEEQSALNLIYLIGSDDPDPFRIFGESDERYHIHGGNDALTRAIAVPILDRIEPRTRLTRARKRGERYVLECEREDGSKVEHTCDRVVFALPFTTLRKVDLDELDLSDDKRAMIDELGYGTNAKVMAAFKTRLWRTEHGSSGSVTTDLPVQQTWDTSIGQAGKHGILTNFLGGEQGLASGEGSAQEWIEGVLPDLEQIFAGITSEYVADSAVRMHWPTQPHTLGSYACYRPGQWSFWATEGAREGKLHFCGEHTSPEFQGWMEGAAETGGRVAKEILDDLGLRLPKTLADVLDDDALLVSAALELPFPQRFLRLRGSSRARV
jgi:monoamine oxidase